MSARMETFAGTPVPDAAVNADGRRYELFTYDAGSDRSWLVAAGFAADRGGWLADILSPAENQVLVDAFGPTMLAEPHAFAWIGGTDAAAEQTWLWDAGPDAGLVFWQGPPGAGAVPGVYSNFLGSEPNNAGPDNYAGILLGAFVSLPVGVWIDSPLHPPLNSDPIGAFIVESVICSADLAAPFDVLDLGDINAFIDAFLSSDPAADLATPLGVWDLADVAQFVDSFLAGCP
jgi:hypothetical protein